MPRNPNRPTESGKRFEGTQAEHRELGIAWHQKYGSMKGFEKEHGSFYDEDGAKRKFRAFTGKGGQDQYYVHQRASSVSAFQQQRKADENRFIEQITEAGQALGLPESSITNAIKQIKAGNNQIKRFVTNFNKGLVKTAQQSTGHIRAVNAGGLNVPENQYLQPRGQNSAEGAKAEPDDTSATMAGSPRDAKEWWIRRGIPSNVDPTRGLDAETTQRIIDTNGDVDAIDDILTEYWNRQPGKARANILLRGNPGRMGPRGAGAGLPPDSTVRQDPQTAPGTIFDLNDPLDDIVESTASAKENPYTITGRGI